MKLFTRSRSPFGGTSRPWRSGGFDVSTLFGQKTLLGQVAAATLLLQAISFVTTWQGAESYLGGVFPFASLLFAVAVQSTVWFFSNSLRGSIAPLRIAALAVAVACSTTFSYIGVYQYIEPPQLALENSYAVLRSNLDARYVACAAEAKDDFCDEVNRLCSALQASQTVRSTEQATLVAARAAYDEAGGSTSLSGALRAPSRWQYADYAEYIAAYNAYLASVTQNTGTEAQAARQAILTQYGYQTIEELSAAETANAAAQSSLSALFAGDGSGAATDFSAGLELLRADLIAAVEGSAQSGFPAPARQKAARLLAACTAAEIDGTPSTDTLFARLDAWLSTTGADLLPTAKALEADLPGGTATRANATELRTKMAAALLDAGMTVNLLAAQGEQIDIAAAEWQLPQVYLLPVRALLTGSGRGTAWFCLGIAALVDGLTLLFSLSGRPAESLLYARSVGRLFAGRGAAFGRQVAACLPGRAAPAQELTGFLAQFHADESAMRHGYSLSAQASGLGEWDRLLALLCQANLARILSQEEGGTVLLKTRFLLWANEQIAPRPEKAVRKEEGVLAS